MLEWIKDNWEWITGLIAAAAAFCSATPTPKKGTVWGYIYKVIEFIGFNFGRAKEEGK